MIGMTNAQGVTQKGYKVTGSPSAPANPNQGDIWVETSAAVTLVSTTAEQVATPSWTGSEGQVYIVTGTRSTDDLYANSERRKGYQLFLYPRSCVQFVSGSWVRKNAYIYNYEGAWVQFSGDWYGTLFYNGNQYTNITNGWVGNGSNATVNGNVLTLKVANSSPYITTSSAINLSEFSKLHIIASANAGQYSYFGVAGVVPVNTTPNFVARGGFSAGTNTLDITALTSGFITVGATASWAATINISKVWLE